MYLSCIKNSTCNLELLSCSVPPIRVLFSFSLFARIHLVLCSPPLLPKLTEPPRTPLHLTGQRKRWLGPHLPSQTTTLYCADWTQQNISELDFSLGPLSTAWSCWQRKSILSLGSTCQVYIRHTACQAVSASAVIRHKFDVYAWVYSQLPCNRYLSVIAKSYRLWGSIGFGKRGIFTCLLMFFLDDKHALSIHRWLVPWLLPARSLTTQATSLHLLSSKPQFRSIINIQLWFLVYIWSPYIYCFWKKSNILVSCADFMPSTQVCRPNEARTSSTLRA